MNKKLFIPLLLGTNRNGRESEKVARWLFGKIEARYDVETLFFDSRDFSLPNNDYGEPLKEMFPAYRDAIARADGLVIVTPEYNHGYPGSLKSILDVLFSEYAHKAVGLAGVSAGPWGGVRVIESLLPTLRELGLVAIKKDLQFPSVTNMFSEEGTMKSEFAKAYDERFEKFFSELLWMGGAGEIIFISMIQKATFALGCFWGPDDYFSKLKGVVRTTVGYSGGTKENPTYADLGDHTESIEIVFDDAVISYDALLGDFWAHHDATQEHKTQYASIIFYHSDEQKAAAEASMRKQEQKTSAHLYTEIRPAGHFYKAEEYHQKYLLKNKGVCL